MTIEQDQIPKVGKGELPEVGQKPAKAKSALDLIEGEEIPELLGLRGPRVVRGTRRARMMSLDTQSAS